MASSWPVEESDYNHSSTVSVNIESLINGQQTNLNAEPCSSQQYASSQLVEDEHLEGGSPSLTDVFQSSMDVSQQIGYCPGLKQVPTPQEQLPQPKEKDEIARSTLDDESGNKESVQERKSIRKRFKKRSYSPESGASQASKLGSMSKKNRRKKKYPRTSAFVNPDRPYDTLPNGSQFQCDLCKCPYICNPLLKKVSKLKKTKQVAASPRHKIDPVTENKLTLCNACGLSFDRPRKTKKTPVVPSAEEKNKYFQESQAFASALAVKMEDPIAEKLWCPNFKSRPCGCLQEYLSANGDQEEMKQRAQQLLEIMKNAKELSRQKCYNVNELEAETEKRTKRFRNIGLGNGQKRSKAFEEFVMLNRSQLRNKLQLCERATQRILVYSNNFLHKKLKTEERECRATRVKGKAALGLLPDLSQLCNMRCCGDMCVMMVLTHFKLLNKWRERAISGQMEARRVLAEMLTPSGGVRSNCYKFISWVTGCSHSTIGRVNEQMQQTGGDREPPVHGLKKYWKENPHLKAKQKNSGTHNTQLTDEMEVTLDSQQTRQTSHPPTTQQQQTVTTATGSKAVNTSNSTLTTVTNVPIETLNQLLVERQLLQQQLMQQTIIQQLYQQESSQNPATIQQLLLKLIENSHVSQQNNTVSGSESTPVYTNCFLRTQPLVSPTGSQVLPTASETSTPTMMVSLDQSAITQQPMTSPPGNITCQQSNKGHQVHLPQNQSQTNISPVITMSSFIPSNPLALHQNLGNQSQVTLPLPSSNELSSVPFQTPINSQDGLLNNTSASSNVIPLTQTQTQAPLGLVHKSVPSISNPDLEPTVQTVTSNTKVTTVPLQTSPATKTVEMVSVSIPMISTNTTGLAENWTNLSVQVPQSQNPNSTSHSQQRTNVTHNILPINVLQRFLNVTGVITTCDTSGNTTATVSVPRTSNKYMCKKITNTCNTIVCNPALSNQLGQDQQIPVASLIPESCNVLSTPHLKLAPSSSDSINTSNPNTVCVTETSSSGQFLLPISSAQPKKSAKLTNVLTGDTSQQYINCNTTTVMFQTGEDVELLQLVPLSVTQAGSDDSSGQTGTVTTLTTSHKNLLTSAEQSRTTTTTGVITDLS